MMLRTTWTATNLNSDVIQTSSKSSATLILVQYNMKPQWILKFTIITPGTLNFDFFFNTELMHKHILSLIRKEENRKGTHSCQTDPFLGCLLERPLLFH